MRITQLSYLKNCIVNLSSKTGFGPYRLHRKNTHFVGTEPSVLKYHHVRILFNHPRKFLIKVLDSRQETASALWNSRDKSFTSRVWKNSF